MHELGFIHDLIDKLIDEATRHQAKRIARVKLKIKTPTDIEPESVSFYFERARKEVPLLSEASLELSEEKMTVACSACGKEFEPSEIRDLCPHCDCLCVVNPNSTGLILESYDIEN